MNIRLTLLTREEAESLFLFEKENKDYFERSVPPRPPTYFEYASFKNILEDLIAEQAEQKSFFYLLKDELGELVGRMNLVDIDWQRGTGDTGYRVGEVFTGKGVAMAGLNLMIKEAQIMGLTTLYAKTTLDNIASQKVLEKCEFKKIRIDDKEFIHYELSLN